MLHGGEVNERSKRTCAVLSSAGDLAIAVNLDGWAGPGAVEVGSSARHVLS
jgi:hypothetical protein